MQYSEPVTTAVSKEEGRLKIDVGGCPHGKKKCLKCAIKRSKNDGKGGPGFDPPGYGYKKSSSLKSSIKKTGRYSGSSKGKKLKSVKSSYSLPSLKSMSKKMTFSKVVKSKKSGSLKKFLKGLA